MASSATQLDSAGAARRPRSSAASPARKQKLITLLITMDEEVWPRVGQAIPTTASVAQFDDIDSAQARLESGQPAIVIWDARNNENATAALGRLQRHSDRVAIVVLDADDRRGLWESSVRLGQIAAFVAAPIETAELSAAFAHASEEAQGRAALLGVEDQSPNALRTKSKSNTVVTKSMAVAALLAAIAFGAYKFLQPSGAKSVAAPAATAPANRPKSFAAKPPAAPVEIAANDDAAVAKVDALLEQARQAMLDRRYIEPASDNALNHYRKALLFDPNNGEARQGLDRLATVLLARAQTSIEQRKFDQALQALESARAISPGDPRAVALDASIANQRAELAAAQVQATINAQNYDRAGALLDDALRNKTLPMAQLAQLRDELRRRRDDAEPNRFLKLALVRMQQGKLADGSEDSARAYLEAAKLAGASAAAFEEALQEFTRRVLTAGRLAIDQKNFNDADRLIAEARAVGVSAATLVPLQRDLSAARGQAGHEHTEQQKLVDLLQQRLSQGSVVEPQGDNALYYLSALRNADPKNAAIPPLSRLVQEQIIARARAALDRQRPKDAEPLLKLAADLGPSPDVTLLTAKLATARQADAGAAELVAPGSLKIKRAMQLEYPAAAVAKGVEGWVDLEFLVTAEGRVGTVEVLDSSPPGVFDSAAIAALKRARYEPPRRDGRAVAQRSRVRLSFRLKG